MTDPQLDALLETAAKAPVTPPAFERDFPRQVWREIALRQESQPGWQWLVSFLEFLSTPKPRLAIWAVALGLGIFIGLRSPSRQSDPVSLYARSIHPRAPVQAP